MTDGHTRRDGVGIDDYVGSDTFTGEGHILKTGQEEASYTARVQSKQAGLGRYSQTAQSVASSPPFRRRQFIIVA